MAYDLPYRLAALSVTALAAAPPTSAGPLGRIASLPLGTKLAVTVIVALAAWGIFMRGIVLGVKGRRHLLRRGSYLVAGTLLWFASALVWLGGG